MRGKDMQQAKKKFFSTEEYFKMEENAEYKSEYYDGEIFAMTGASFNRIHRREAFDENYL